MSDEKQRAAPVGSGEPTAHMSIRRYAATRISTLKPPMDKAPNPFKLLGLLNRQQWLFFLVAFLAWSWDAFDFFTVSLTVQDLANTFDKSKTDITWGITLVLMLRSVGAIIFGIASDRYGRKWPFVVNNILFIVLELGTGFCSSYRSFLAVRALFGMAPDLHCIDWAEDLTNMQVLQWAVYTVTLLQQLWKIALRQLEVFFPACFNKDMLLDICLQLYSHEV